MLINNDTDVIKKTNLTVIILISLSFVLSDWLISIITISDILMLFIIGIISIKGIDLKKSDKTSFFVIEGFLLIHILLHAVFNSNFILRIAITNSIKIIYYHIFIVLTYRYIIAEGLQKSFLKVLNIIAVIAIIIGLYITATIVFETNLPYEFFWFLTRNDRFSYTLRGTNTVIRTRSIFSEPAHLGYFLNIVLAFNLFTKYTSRGMKYFNLLIIIGVIATLSYSSIGVLLVILSIFIISNIGKIKITFWKALIFILIVLFTIFIFKDFLYQAIYIRTFDILSGNDGSMTARFFSSWSYIDYNDVLLGNGLGRTPPLQNIYAYFLSDLGLIAFIIIIILTGYLIKLNTGLGITFLALNFSKGGYLSPIFTLLILSLMIFVSTHKEKNLNP